MMGLPTGNGKLKDISRFDATMFGVHPKQANGMDPQLRMLLEVVYEAIADAGKTAIYFNPLITVFQGVNPATVRGSRTGVFIGCSASESHDAWSKDLDKIVGYEMTGCTRSMFANRISFFFDFKGKTFELFSITTLIFQVPVLPLTRRAPPACWPWTRPSTQSGRATATLP